MRGRRGAVEKALFSTASGEQGEEMCELGDEAKTCSATVGEWESCVDDGIASVKSFAAKLPDCSGLTKAKLTGLNVGEPEEPASCKALDMKCPGLSVSTSMMMSGE